MSTRWRASGRCARRWPRPEVPRAVLVEIRATIAAYEAVARHYPATVFRTTRCGRPAMSQWTPMRGSEKLARSRRRRRILKKLGGRLPDQPPDQTGSQRDHAGGASSRPLRITETIPPAAPAAPPAAPRRRRHYRQRAEPAPPLRRHDGNNPGGARGRQQADAVRAELARPAPAKSATIRSHPPRGDAHNAVRITIELEHRSAIPRRAHTRIRRVSSSTFRVPAGRRWSIRRSASKVGCGRGAARCRIGRHPNNTTRVSMTPA